MRGLLSVLEAIGGARVLVVGDVMLDRAIHGHAARLSPEAPVPVLSVEREEVRLGGAGNVLGNLRALCVESHLVAVVGDDGPGREIVHLAGVGHSLIVDSKRPTTVKERHFAGGQQLLRCDREDASPLSNAMAQQVMRVARNRLDEVDVLLLSDYGKGVLAPATTRALIAAAGEAGCPVVADPKGGDYGVYRGVAVITPNLNELQEASGWILGPDDDLTPACYDLLARTGVQAVLATQGARGMTLVRPDHPACHIPTSELIQVWDVTGAGDTVVALVAASLAVGVGLGGVDLERAARLASIAAGIAVGKAGTALVSRSEIRQALWADNGRQGGNDQPGEGKEVERDDLLARVNQWRSAGLTVGFTNGCFDLLHPGHVSLLRQARAACGRLGKSVV